MLFSACLGFLSGVVLAVATPVEPREAQGEKLPIIHLPYGSFEATDRRDKVYRWKNIPFAAPPVGDLRWAKPAPPVKVDGIQYKNRTGAACFQPPLMNMNTVEDITSVGDLIDHFRELLFGTDVDGDGVKGESSFGAQNEDCLFLNIQVPLAAIEDPKMKLPVVVYMHGGGFMTGDKDLMQPLYPLYDGMGLIKKGMDHLIFIAFNYRVGAFGFLGGSSMEKDATPNAGLWDQRAAFTWVQEHIHSFGGNPKNVTALGHSAGAGSIIHHLVAEGGTLDPQFNRALLLSPAYEPKWDRAGMVEDNFKEFTKLVEGCEQHGVECLRKADTYNLERANLQLLKNHPKGSYPLGPVPDGSFIRQSPTLELQAGNIWPIDSAFISHTREEGNFFAKMADIQSDAEFGHFVDALLPEYVTEMGIAQRVKDMYPDVNSKKNKDEKLYKDQHDRVGKFITESCLNCHARYLGEALGSDKVWTLLFDGQAKNHGDDIIPLFHYAREADSFVEFVSATAQQIYSMFTYYEHAAYQTYLSRYLLFGNPKTLWDYGLWENNPDKDDFWFPDVLGDWRHPDYSGEHVKNVMRLKYPNTYRVIKDRQMPKSRCDFWRNFTAAATVGGGYAPPGVVPEQDWVDSKNASEFY